MTWSAVIDLVDRIVNGWSNGAFADAEATVELWDTLLEDFTDEDAMTGFKRIIRDPERKPGPPGIDEIVRYAAVVKRERKTIEWQNGVRDEYVDHRLRLIDIESREG